MKLSTKAFLGGIGVAALVLGATTLNTWRLDRREGQLERNCVKLGQDERAKSDAAANATAAAEVRRIDAAFPAMSQSEVEALAKKYNVNPFDLFEMQDAIKERRARNEVDPAYMKVPPWDLPAERQGHLDLELTCDPAALASLDNLKGIQLDIVHAQTAAQGSRGWPLILAVGLACHGAVPWLWYFLLHRIAEIRAALSGNPPSR